MLYVLIILSLLFIGYVLKRNQTISLFFIGLLVYLFANINSGIPDYGNYYQYYYGGEYYRDFLQKGYENISIFLLNQGYSFESFRFVLALLTFIVMWIAIRMWTQNIALVLAFYLLVNFPMDIIQIRNFVMLGFTTLAITFLAKPGYLKYGISLGLIWIGSQFHTMGLIYIAIIAMTLLPDQIEKKIRKYSVPGVILGSIFFELGARTSFLQAVAGFVGQLSGNETQLTDKLTGRYVTGTSLSMILVVLFVNIIIFVSVNKISQFEINSKDEDIQSITNVIRNVVSFGLLLSPLMIIAPDYARIFRNFELLTIIYFVMILSKTGTTVKSKNIAILGLIMMSIAGVAVWGRYFSILF